MASSVVEQIFAEYTPGGNNVVGTAFLEPASRASSPLAGVNCMLEERALGKRESQDASQVPSLLQHYRALPMVPSRVLIFPYVSVLIKGAREEGEGN